MFINISSKYYIININIKFDKLKIEIMKLKFKSKKEFAQAILKYGALWDYEGNKIWFDESFPISPFRINDSDLILSFKTFAEEWSTTPPLKDKDLVWCWDNDSRTSRLLAFYDAKHNACFDDDGDRNGTIWDNFEKYEGEWPEWAKEAVKTLED